MCKNNNRWELQWEPLILFSAQAANKYISQNAKIFLLDRSEKCQ